LLPIAQTVTRALGAEQYIFSWLVLDEKSSDVIEHRYLVGCDPAWLNKYIDRVWYMNDPLLDYAKRNVKPVLSSRLDLYSDAHWLATEAATHGLRNNLVCPVHAGTNSFLVMLQASNAEPRKAGEGILWRNRRLLRELACELLDWRLVGLRQQATSQFDLGEQDLEVLRMVHDGGKASHVAEVLNVSVKAVYKVVYPRINQKMGTPGVRSHALRVTLFTALQLPLEHWHAWLQDPTLADAISRSSRASGPQAPAQGRLDAQKAQTR
jgi:hypothetical protein